MATDEHQKGNDNLRSQTTDRVNPSLCDSETSEATNPSLFSRPQPKPILGKQLSDCRSKAKQTRERGHP